MGQPGAWPISGSAPEDQPDLPHNLRPTALPCGLIQLTGTSVGMHLSSKIKELRCLHIAQQPAEKKSCHLVLTLWLFLIVLADRNQLGHLNIVSNF